MNNDCKFLLNCIDTYHTPILNLSLSVSLHLCICFKPATNPPQLTTTIQQPNKLPHPCCQCQTLQQSNRPSDVECRGPSLTRRCHWIPTSFFVCLVLLGPCRWGSYCVQQRQESAGKDNIKSVMTFFRLKQLQFPTKVEQSHQKMIGLWANPYMNAGGRIPRKSHILTWVYGLYICGHY